MSLIFHDVESVDPSEAGFTLLELIIVTLVMAIVLSIAATSLTSMSMGTRRGDVVVTEEQAATLAINHVSQDIRSAHTLSSAVTGAPSSTELVLLINDPNASVDNVNVCQTSSVNPDYTPVPYQLVEWQYQTGPGTLVRTLLNCGASGNPSLGKTWSLGPQSSTQGVTLSIANGASAVFNYYNQYGTNISSALPSAIASCTTRIGIDLKVASNVKGTPTFEEVQHDALTDQIDILSQPGNGQC